MQTPVLGIKRLTRKIQLLLLSLLLFQVVLRVIYRCEKYWFHYCYYYHRDYKVYQLGERTFVKRQKAKVEIKGENAKYKAEEEEAMGENELFH